GILNAMTSAPELALASRIAWASEPAPEDAVLVTVNVVPAADTRSGILPLVRASMMRHVAMIKVMWIRRTLLSMGCSLSSLKIEVDYGDSLRADRRLAAWGFNEMKSAL